MAASWRVVTRTPQVFTGALVIGLWELLAVFVKPSWLPTVQAVASNWWDLARSGAFGVVGGSFETLGIGLLIVFVGGGALAGLLAWSRLADEALSPLLNAVLATPNIALVPLYMFIFGLGDTTRVVAVIGFAVLPVTLDWVAAIKGVPAPLLEMSSSFDASRRAKVRTVIVPAAAPLLLTGLRIGVVQGIKGVVTAEILIGVAGVGKLLVNASATFDLPQLYAVIISILAVSILSYVILSYLESRTGRWTEERAQ